MKTAWAAFALLALAQALCRPDAPRADDAALHRALPGVVQALGLGAARPFVLHYLWWRFETEHQRGELIGVLRDLYLLQEIDPKNGLATLHLAHVLAFDLAPREPDAGARFGRVMEALRPLESAESAAADDPRFPRLRAIILHAAWSVEPELHARFERQRRMTPAAAAVEAARAAAARSGGSRSDRNFFAALALERAIEQLHARDPADAAATLDAARDALAAGPEASGEILSGLVVAWRALAEGFRSGDAVAIAGALDALREVIVRMPDPEHGGTGVEDSLLHSILKPALEIAGGAASAPDPQPWIAVLAAAQRVETTLAERGAVPERERRALSDRIRDAVAALVRSHPGLEGRLPPGLPGPPR